MALSPSTALQRIRAAGAAGDPSSIAQAALSALAEAAPGVRFTLSHAALEGEIVAGACAGDPSTRFDVTIPDDGMALVRAEAASALDEVTRTTIELLAGAVIQELRVAAAETSARRAARQLQLLYGLARTGADVADLEEIADRASLELIDAFGAGQVAVHVLRGDVLELVGRRLVTGERGVEAAPDWLRRMPVDEPSMQARALSDRAVVHGSLPTLPARAREVLEPLGVRHLLVAPLVFNERLIGTVSIAHRREAAWDAEELKLLANACRQIAMSLMNASLYETERSRARELVEINQLGSLVTQHLDLPTVLRTVVQRMAAIADVPRVTLFLADDARTELRTAACSDGTVSSLTLPLNATSAAAHAFHLRAPVRIAEVHGDPRAARDLPPGRAARSLLAVPLIARGEPIGSLVLAETRDSRHFSQEEVDRAVAVANLVAPTITNAQMFEDLRRSYDALGRAQAELVTHERLAALGELSAVMAHEVRNPLAIIFNSLGSLRRVVEPTGDARLLLDIVGEEAARLNRIVGDLLDFVKPYASHPRPAHVADIVRAAVEAACRAAPTSSVNVETELDVPAEEVLLDGYMLQQALINLIVNAIQAMPKGGRVVVRVSCDAARPLRLRCEIDDQGPGIAPTDAARIFQPFFTTKASGTGLGLAVVKRIADALSGEVGVTPVPSGGTRFSLVVPLLEEARAPEGAPAS